MPCPFIGPKQFSIDPNCFEKGPYFMNIGPNKKNSAMKTLFWSYPKQFVQVQNIFSTLKRQLTV